MSDSIQRFAWDNPSRESYRRALNKFKKNRNQQWKRQREIFRYYVHEYYPESVWGNDKPKFKSQPLRSIKEVSVTNDAVLQSSYLDEIWIAYFVTGDEKFSNQVKEAGETFGGVAHLAAIWSYKSLIEEQGLTPIIKTIN